MRSIVCNPTKSECNHHEVMYVINLKEETYKAYALITYSSQGELTTYAYRRLHTNPSDWIKNKTVRRLSYFLEVPPRFELGNESFADSCLTTWPRYHMK